MAKRKSIDEESNHSRLIIADLIPEEDDGDRICEFRETTESLYDCCEHIRRSLTDHHIVFHPYRGHSKLQGELLKESSLAKSGLAQGFHRIIVLDVNRAVDQSGLFDLSQFYAYAFKQLTGQFGLDLTESYHEEDMVQILRDEPTSLICLLNVHRIESEDRKRLRGLTQEGHQALILYRIDPDDPLEPGFRVKAYRKGYLIYHGDFTDGLEIGRQDVFDTEKLHAQITAAAARMRPVLARISEDRAKAFDARVNDVKNRVASRLTGIINHTPPRPLEFNAQGWAPLANWEPRADGDAKLEKREFEGRTCLVVETGPSGRTTASFRTKALLARGSYRLEARAKPQDLKPLTDEKGTGAGLRMSGGNRQNQTSGSADWQPLTYAFDITEDLRQVELVAELRGTAGKVAFDAASLRLVKVK